MSRRLPLPCLAFLGSIAALTAAAQSVPQARAEADHAPQARVATPRSTLENYQPFTDETVAPWRQSNDTVGKIGGWRAYAKEAHEAGGKGEEAPAASSPSPTPDKAGKGRP